MFNRKVQRILIGDVTKIDRCDVPRTVPLVPSAGMWRCPGK